MYYYYYNKRLQQICTHLPFLQLNYAQFTNNENRFKKTLTTCRLYMYVLFYIFELVISRWYEIVIIPPHTMFLFGLHPLILTPLKTFYLIISWHHRTKSLIIFFISRHIILCLEVYMQIIKIVKYA